MSNTYNKKLNTKKSSANYLFSLIIICLLVMSMCILYLKLQFKVINSNNEINILQTKVNRLKERNDIIYNENKIKNSRVNDENKNSNNKNNIESEIIQYKSIPKADDVN